LKTVVAQVTVGSNPTPSAIINLALYSLLLAMRTTEKLGRRVQLWYDLSAKYRQFVPTLSAMSATHERSEILAT
jgi:hypothetical protein